MIAWRGQIGGGLLLVCLAGGCLSSEAPATKTWTVESVSGDEGVVASGEGGGIAFGTTRVGAVTVDAPYDKPLFVVRRADGTVAFDHYNTFAASPAALLRVPVRRRLASDGRFGCVVPQVSIAAADTQVEAQVTDLSLDCRSAGRRMARAAVTLDVVKTGRGSRAVVFVGAGAGESDAADGNYSRAFSEAVDAAVIGALKDLRGVEGSTTPKGSSVK